MSSFYSHIIVGGGVSGVLTATRILNSITDAKVLLLEKEPYLGGRLRSSSEDRSSWGYGLNAISQDLFVFFDQTMKIDPEAKDLPSYLSSGNRNFGVLAGGKIREVPVTEALSKKGARALAGAAAARDWDRFDQFRDKLSAEGMGSKPVTAVWKGGRKTPSAIVLEHLSHWWGIPDLWGARCESLLKRAEIADLVKGRWGDALTDLVDRFREDDRLMVIAGCEVLGAQKTDEGHWALLTELGAQAGSWLIVAQPPWEAIRWLPRDVWPTKLLNLTLKSKPVSVVTLTSFVNEGGLDLPETILIPSESVQAVSSQGEICFQATLDYEMTLDAPAVVKAVKRLKRAKKKLLSVQEGLELEGDHLALHPVGWSQTVAHAERRWFETLRPEDCLGENLAFCGDAYGPDPKGDRNIVQSVSYGCDLLEKSWQAGDSSKAESSAFTE